MAVRKMTDDEVNAEIVKNMGLVGNVANQFQGRGLDWEDLLQEGAIGLRRAILKFDPAMGFKLSTYACPWIRLVIGRAIKDKSRTIQVPAYLQSLDSKLSRMGDDFDANCDRLGVTQRKRRMLRKARARNVSADVDLSLACAGDRDDGPDLEQLHAALDALLPDDRDLIRTHYGIGCDPKILRQIGAERRLTRDRISQMEILAKQRLAAILNPPEPEPVALPELSPPAPRQRRCRACGAVLVRRKESRQGEQRAFWLARRHCNRACAAITRWEAARATGEAAAVGA